MGQDWVGDRSGGQQISLGNPDPDPWPGMGQGRGGGQGGGMVMVSAAETTMTLSWMQKRWMWCLNPNILPSKHQKVSPS